MEVDRSEKDGSLSMGKMEVGDPSRTSVRKDGERRGGGGFRGLVGGVLWGFHEDVVREEVAMGGLPPRSVSWTLLGFPWTTMGEIPQGFLVDREVRSILVVFLGGVRRRRRGLDLHGP